MSAEVPFVLPERHQAIRAPRYVTPADMIATQQPARWAFDNFMRHYGGEPQEYADFSYEVVDADGVRTAVVKEYGPFALGLMGYEYPEVTRWRENEGNVTYPGVGVSGFTDMGRLVHVRWSPDHQDPGLRYIVALGDLRTGELVERRVVEVSHSGGMQQQLETTLYLEGGDEDWPLEYWPQVTMTQRENTYYSGGDSRIEKVKGIHELYMKSLGRTGLMGPTLHAVQ